MKPTPESDHNHKDQIEAANGLPKYKDVAAIVAIAIMGLCVLCAPPTALAVQSQKDPDSLLQLAKVTGCGLVGSEYHSFDQHLLYKGVGCANGTSEMEIISVLAGYTSDTKTGQIITGWNIDYLDIFNQNLIGSEP